MTAGELAERAYARLAEDMRSSRTMGTSRALGLGKALQKIEPALIELAGERAQALEAIAERLADEVWSREPWLRIA